MIQKLGSEIGIALERLLEAFLAVIPALLVLIVALALGAAFGLLLRTLLRVLLRLSGRSPEPAITAKGPAGILRAAGLPSNVDRLAGSISFWAAVVVSLVVGINALQPSALRDALSGLVTLLPQLLIATLLFVAGLGLAALARRSVLLAAVNAGLPWARGGARAVHGVVLVFFTAIALDHMGLGRAILVAAFSIVMGGIVLALALAFGLGARDLARQWLEKKLRAEADDSGIRHL